MSITWEDIEDRIHEAVVRATGFADDRVVWKWQDADAPALDYATVDLGVPVAVGEDRIRYQTDLTRPQGQEVKQTIRGTREVALELEVFCSAPRGNNSAKAVMARTQMALRIPSIKHLLRLGGLSVFDLGVPGYVNDIPTVNFRGRATCSMRCYVVLPEVVEYCGYIARVRGTVRAQPAWTGVSGIARTFDTNDA
jgi:hypothetical protein